MIRRHIGFVLRPFVSVLQAPHNTFNYYFSGINTQSDRFWLDPSTGQIYVRRILSGETQNTFTVSELYWTFIFCTFYNFDHNIYDALYLKKRHLFRCKTCSLVPVYYLMAQLQFCRFTFCLFIFFSQYNAFARDNGSPQLESASIPVTINVRRNQFPPVFQNEPYSRAITSSVGTGTSILSVTATDADNFVSRELKI